MAFGLDKLILEEARVKPEHIRIVCAVLTRKNGQRVPVYPICEYGDGDATNMVREFIKEAKPSLHKGESLCLETWVVHLP